MVKVDETTRVSISVRSGKNGSSSQLKRLLLCQIIMILCIQHTICESLTRSNTEQVSSQSGSVGINVVQGWTFGWSDAGAHGTHGETTALVRVDDVGEDLGGGCDGDAALLAELVETALHSEIGEPVLTVLFEVVSLVLFHIQALQSSSLQLRRILQSPTRSMTYSSTTSHCAQQAVINLNNLLDSLRSDPVSSRSSGIGGDNNASLESECECGGSVSDLNGAVWVGVVVGCCAKPC